MFKQIFARITGKSSATGTDNNEVRVDTSGGLGMGGTVAHDAVDAGSPIKIGARANAEGYTAISEGDRGDVGIDLRGNLRAVGNVANDTADVGNPIKIGLQARQTNPTAVADADRVNAMGDDVGRVVNWPYQVRDLSATAAATLSNGTAATLLAAGGAGVMHDLIHVSCANTSTAAATIQLLQDGSVMKNIQVPASSTLSLDFTFPLPQASSNTIWSVDMEDITGTTLYVDALFIKNV